MSIILITLCYSYSLSIIVIPNMIILAILELLNLGITPQSFLLLLYVVLLVIILIHHKIASSSA
jgi:hypothetical protein